MDARSIQVALCTAGYIVNIDGDLGPETYGGLFAYVGRAPIGQLTSELGAAAALHFPTVGLVTPIRVAHALARWAVETGGFRRLEENLSYSAERLLAVWPGRFPNRRAALPFENQPTALAENVYGGRLGNRELGDGWKYHGRGPTMLTFKSNYADASTVTGLDLVDNPDQVAEPGTGLLVACAYWKKRKINAAADADDVAKVCRLVQGGAQGLEDQRAYLARARRVLQ